MFLIQVIPLSRGILKEKLSYFSASAVGLGDIVRVPLRGRTVPALVCGVADAATERAQLRGADFSLRKIDARTARRAFLPALARAAERTADHVAGTTGAVLAALVPTAILTDPPPVMIHDEKRTASIGAPVLALQADRVERADEYRSLIREEFARGASVFILVPTVADGEHLAEELSKGIENYAHLLHGSMRATAQREGWIRACKEEHPILVVGTAQFLSLPRNDLRAIVIEHEQSESYRGLARPYLDARVFAEYVAAEMGARLIFADLPLRAETVARLSEGSADELRPVRRRMARSVQAQIADMRRKAPVAGEVETERVPFTAIGPALHERIAAATAAGERIFLFTARRGLAPITVCNDCGTTVNCRTCNSPVVLHTPDAGDDAHNIFLCHTCGAKRSAHEVCIACSSWRLTPLGIGVERVRQELGDGYPHVFTFDRDTVRSHREAQRVARDFYRTRGAILIGTAMALPYLAASIEHTAVVSADSLLSMPQWRAHERLLNILFTIHSMASKTFLIQTRQPEEKLLAHATGGELAGFYEDELESRQQFGYPPYMTLVKLAVSGRREPVAALMKELSATFEPYNLHIYAPAIAPRNNAFALYGLLKIPRERWPEKKLLALLRGLPPQVGIEVDPESLL